MSDEHNELFSRGEEFLTLFKRGADFTRELLVENERLRSSLARVEDEQTAAVRSPEEWDKYRHELTARLQDLEAEYETVRVRLHQVEEENQQFAERYLEINGVWEDHYRYAVTAEEWSERGPAWIADWID